MPESYDETLHHVSYDTIDHVAEISDPGERGRENHLWGDRLTIWVGNVAAWLFPILMMAIVAQVILRKSGNNQAWLDDAQWWMYGTAMLVGFCYAITTDSHVRVDIFHEHFPARKKARIEVFSLGWLLLPFLAIMTDVMIHYAYASILAREGSDSASGLQGLFLLKSLMPVLFVVAMIASFAALKRNLMVLTEPRLWHMMLAAFPAVWFIAERAVRYVLWWYIRLTQPDINPRRIGRESLLDNTVWYGLALVILVVVISFVMAKRNSEKA